MRLVICGLSICCATVAAAQPVIDVHVEPCAGDEITIRQLVDLELDATGHPAESAIAHVKCVDAAFAIEVDDRLTHKRLERRLANTGDERVIALAIVELVRASWLELEAPITSGESRAALRRQEWSVGAGLQLRRIGTFTSFGVTVTLHDNIGRLLIDADVTFEHADRTISAGEVDAESTTGSLRAGIALHAKPLVVELAAGVRAGTVSLTGKPRMELAGQLVGNRITGPWLAPVAVVKLRTGDRLGIGLVGELGAAIASVRGTIGTMTSATWGGGFVAVRANVEMIW